MSNQVVRLVTGDVIEIRTGAIQGIGPQGNQGDKGDKGDQGDMGPASTVPGPMGEVAEHATSLRLSSAVVISDATPTTVVYDTQDLAELGTVGGSWDTITVPAGRYFLSATAEFASPGSTGSGIRDLTVLAGSGVIAGATTLGVGGRSTYLTATALVVFNATTALTTKVWQNQTAGVSLTRATLGVSRIGPGVQGPQGPEGPEGPEGPASTVPGPPGTLSPTTTFADIGG